MPTSTPLRLLVITSRPLVDSKNRRINLLDVAQERARVRDALQHAGAAIHAHFLPDATVDAMTRAFAQEWDAVHITGHGSRDGELLLEDEFGVAQFLNARDVVALMGAARPRVFVLSLCYAGKALPDALLAAGAQAVIAIDADEPILDDAATFFNETFYALLARGESVGKAFESAQTRVRHDPRVGDKAFVASGEKGIPYSERFTLSGDSAFAFASEQGAYQESGAPRALGNLRTRNRNFVGRAQEIVQIVKAFDARGMQANARRVALHGAGGLGKTELAQAVAWWYAERGRVGAVVWASASPTEDEFVLRDLASLLAITGRALKLNFSEQLPFDEQKAIVREGLGAQETLLLLDNWETLVNTEKAREVWNFVLNLPPSVRVLVTSRDKLPPKDAENVELETLAPDDAAQLFLNIARRAGYFKNNPQLSGQEAAALGAIIERLGGYALAIEVVAGQTESRTLGVIWRDLVQYPENVLQGKTEFGEPRGVWTSLDFSYNVLPDAEKEMFRGMGVFLAPATDEDIAAILQPVIASPEGAKQSPTNTGIASSGAEFAPRLAMTRETLDTLVKRSLVRFREGHYALLHIVRDYAESCLADAGQDPEELHIRAGQHFAGKETLEGALTASDHLYQLAARFQSEQAAKVFIKYVSSFYQDLVTRGYWAEARRKTEELIVVAQALDDKVTEAQAISELGNRYYQIGEYGRGSELYKQAQELSTEGGNKSGIANTLGQMGMVAQAQGNYPEALRLYGDAIATFQALGDKSGIASTLHQMGNVAYLQGNYPEALRLYGENMQLAQALGDKSGIASTLHQMGNVAYSQGNYPKALRLYGDAIATFQALGDKRGIAITLHQMGMVAQDQGNYPEALRLYGESMQLKQALGDKRGIASTLGQMGNVAYSQGNYPEALRLYGESMQLAQALGDKRGIAITLHQMGMVAQDQGNYPEALRLYGESMQLKQALGDKSGIAITLHQMGMVAQAQGNYPEALRLYGESMQLAQELGDKSGIASTLHQMGMVAHDQGNYPEALRLYGESMQLAQELGDKSGIATTLGQMGKLVQQQGELKDALGYYLGAFVRFYELQSPNLGIVARWMQELRAQAGQEQFAAWLEEFVSDEASRRALVEILDSVV